MFYCVILIVQVTVFISLMKKAETMLAFPFKNQIKYDMMPH